MIASGFSEEEIQVLQQELPPALKVPTLQILPADPAMRQECVADLIDRLQHPEAALPDPNAAPLSPAAGADDAPVGTGSTPAPNDPAATGRIMYFVDDTQQYAGFVNNILVDLEIAPAIMGARQAKHDELTLQAALLQLRAAHLQYHKLHQPVHTAEGVAMNLDDVVVSVNAVLDAGQVPDASGEK